MLTGMSKNDLDTFFREVALAALRKAKDVALVAKVNHLDNFTHAYAGSVSYVVCGEVDVDKADHIAWFNSMCSSGTRTRGISAVNQQYIPYECPFIREVCKTVYDEIRGA